MASSQRLKGHDSVLTALDLLIQTVNIAKDACGIPPAQVAFGSASVLLTMIRDTMANDGDYVELGQACADVCQALYQRLKGRRCDELNQLVLDAIGNLNTALVEMQRKVVKRGKRNGVIRFILSKDDKDKIAAWKQDLVRILQVFNTQLVIDTHMAVSDTQTMVADMHQRMLAGHEGASGQNDSTQARSAIPNTMGSAVLHSYSTNLGELPPPAPRDCFGRDELIEKLVGFAENLKPVALIGAGGIGKTSITLKVLHHSRIKQRFGNNRRFIRCDQFSPSPAPFLSRLSKVIGAGVENPEDLISLRPFLSSKEMLLVLDNAESILDPKGQNAEEIYSVVDELCQFETICLCITSRITTVPPRCKRPKIPTLSMEAACDIFYDIYSDRGQSSIVNDLLEHLDFHALSITLLATTASQNSWDYNRLAREWDTQRAQALQTYYNKSLATTIELSLSSPTFRSIGPHARDLLGVVAFFPQGINEKNLGWLLPTIPESTFDTLCVLSLTYRGNGFLTMLAPIRDYLGPRDPRSSPLLCTTRDIYFGRLSVNIDPGTPEFEGTRWILSEDVNVEHLLDVSTTIVPDLGDNWDACRHFIEHLYWHKPRQTTLSSNIEALPDDHCYKATCLSELSRLFGQVGNYSEQKRLLSHILELYRQGGDSLKVASTLQQLADVNRSLGLYGEGIQQAGEALEIFKQAGNTIEQMQCSDNLAWLLFEDKQLDAAENVASSAMGLASGKGQEFVVCRLHRVLGKIYGSKGEKKEAIRHFETAIGIATPFNWHDILFWNQFGLAILFWKEGELEDASVHVERAKPYAVDEAYKLGRAMKLQARILDLQHRFEEAKSEALGALEIYEKLGAAKDAGNCREFLKTLEWAMKNRSGIIQE